MLILPFSIFLGILTCVFLIAPNRFYIAILVLASISILAFIILKKRFKTSIKFFYYPIAAVFFLAAYILSAMFIFKPKEVIFPKSAVADASKAAVIFYCQGEMERYTPYCCTEQLKKYSIIEKPIMAFELKNFYKRNGVSGKNYSLIKVASEVKNSLLNNGPYYFYIAFSSYTPDLSTSLSQAIKDGCGSITIINYTCNEKLEEKLENQLGLKDLESSLGISIKITEPVCSSQAFQQLFIRRIINMPEKFDGIFLIGNYTPFSSSIQTQLIDNGYLSKQIYISPSIKKGISYFKEQNCTGILYVDLCQSGCGVEAETIIPSRISRQNPSFKVTGIKEWGYNIDLVKASIEILNKCNATP